MGRKKNESLEKIVKMNYPINVRLNSDSPYRGGVVVNGIKITEVNTLIVSSEMMKKLKPIEKYLCFEPIKID